MNKITYSLIISCCWSWRWSYSREQIRREPCPCEVLHLRGYSKGCLAYCWKCRSLLRKEGMAVVANLQVTFIKNIVEREGDILIWCMLHRFFFSSMWEHKAMHPIYMLLHWINFLGILNINAHKILTQTRSHLYMYGMHTEQHFALDTLEMTMSNTSWIIIHETDSGVMICCKCQEL